MVTNCHRQSWFPAAVQMLTTKTMNQCSFNQFAICAISAFLLPQLNFLKNLEIFGAVATQVVMTFRSFSASKHDLCAPRRRQESCTLGAVPGGVLSTTLEKKGRADSHDLH